MEADSHQEAAEGGAQPRASFGAVFGIAAGFMILAACIGTLLGFGPSTAVAAETLGEHFSVGELPFGLQLHPEVFLLPGGEEVYAMRGEGVDLVQISKALKELEAESKQMKPGGAEEEPVDWTAMQVNSTGGPPSQVFLVHYSLRQAESVIAKQFRALRWRELSEIEARGGHSAVGGGKLEWNGYSANYVRDRQFRRGLRFMDQVRVNLTVGGECWVAYGIWPDQHEGSKEKMAEVLA
ncbi:MAG: hypothetical protein ACI9F9_001920, partial [Candidatus Paceibacteria bacterium]